MKEFLQEFLKNRKQQKFLILGSAVCIFPIWITVFRDKTPGTIHYILMVIGLLLFWVDRQLKPWELDNAERQQKKAEAQYAAQKAALENKEDDT
ncbi:MAG: hypothetical protein E7442_03740 [Ruminococcaceae bacterium]|nr:hypothetical protein [Oscillospiraceae bacterium]